MSFANFDTVGFLSIYSLSHHSAFLDLLGKFFAEYSVYVCIIVLVVAVLYPSANRARNRVTVMVSVVAALIARLGVKTAIALAFPRPRPFVSLPDIYPLITSLPSENLQSFPSGHMIFFFALATVLFYFNKKVGIFAFVAAVLVGIARIYVGVHWPTDILGGAALGMLTGWATYRYYIRHAAYLNEKIGQSFKLLRL